MDEAEGWAGDKDEDNGLGKRVKEKGSPVDEE